MLEKKINYLRNVIFSKSIILIIISALVFWYISFAKESYNDLVINVDLVKPLIQDTRMKLHEIKDSNLYITESIKTYENAISKTEEMRCKEYQDIMTQIVNLSPKYNLNKPFAIKMLPKIRKINLVHNKSSYIGVYDFHLEFSAKNMTDIFEIYNEIYNLLPQYSVIYFLDIKSEPVKNHQANDHNIITRMNFNIRDIVIIK